MGDAEIVVLAHSHELNDLSNVEYLAFENSIRQSLINENINAHQLNGFDTRYIENFEVWPVLYLAYIKSIRTLDWRIDLTPYWFFVGMNEDGIAHKCFCIACDEEYAVDSLGESCLGCGYSQCAIAESKVDIPSMRKYLIDYIEDSKKRFEQVRYVNQVAWSAREKLVIGHQYDKIPKNIFKGTLKQIDIDNSSMVFKDRFNVAFGEFLKPSYPNQINAGTENKDIETIIAGSNIYKKAKGRYRRYSGGNYFPANRYYTVCENSSGYDQNTLTSELLSYSTPEYIQAYPALYDTTINSIPLPILEIVNTITEEIDSYVCDLSIPILFVLGRKSLLTGDIVHDILSSTYLMSTNLIVKDVAIPNVLDLRRIASQIFLSALICQFRQIGLGVKSSLKKHFIDQFVYPNFGLDNINGINSDFMNILGNLVSPLKGGGEFNDAVGKLLQCLGYDGLIYPSARHNMVQVIKDQKGNLISKGWCFVDFREVEVQTFNKEDLNALSLVYYGSHLNPRKIYATYSNGIYKFASGFVIHGAEERDSKRSAKRSPST